MNPNQYPTGQNAAQYLPQYAGYMPTDQAGYYPAVYTGFPAYPGYPAVAGPMDPQYMGYYGMTSALPPSTAIPSSQAPSATNSQVNIVLCF